MTHSLEDNEDWNKFSPVLVETPKFSAYGKKILILSDEQNSSVSFIFAFVFFRSATSGPQSHLRLIVQA